MEEQSTNNSPGVDSVKKKHVSFAHHFIFGLISLVIACAASVGVFVWQHNNNASLTTKINDLQHRIDIAHNDKTSSPASQPKQSGNVHFVESFGRPYDSAANNYDFITKLGIPSIMQAVRTPSSNNFLGPEEAFTNEYNNELGRWTLGNPGYDEDGGSSQISLLAITNAWLTSTGHTDYSLSYGSGNPLETPAQKAQYMSQLESTTSTCTKQRGKGFVTIDGSLDVCYTFEYGQGAGAYGVYDPLIELSGYGDIKGQPLLLTGLIFIYDPSVGTNPATLQQLQVNATAGHPPTQTVNDQTAIIDALKQTTISVTPATVQ